MSARKSDVIGDAAGTIVLVCDRCGATFTARRFGADRTRMIADVRQGWKVATFADRTDYCATCKGVTA